MIILFDMDGTLFESETLWWKSFNEVLREHGKDGVSKQLYFRDFVGRRLSDILLESFPNEPEDARSRMELRWVALWRGEQGEYRLTPGIVETLGELRNRKFRMGVVTATFHREADEVLRFHGLRDYFEFVIGGDDVKKAKPDPEGILTACGRLGAGPEEAIYIGDTAGDAKAAKAAGCTMVALLNEFSNKEALGAADYMIEDIHELLGIVREKNQNSHNK